MGDAKKCEYCGEPFTPKRSTGRFCGNHRKYAYKKREAQKKREERIHTSEQRAAMSMSFDGRIGGPSREGFATPGTITVWVNKTDHRINPSFFRDTAPQLSADLKRWRTNFPSTKEKLKERRRFRRDGVA